MHAVRVMIAGEAEAVIRIKPTVIGLSAGVCFVYYHMICFYRFRTGEVVKAHRFQLPEFINIIFENVGETAGSHKNARTQ
ncbi:hypothetical protein D9M68_707300 [compost metagenome]